VLSHPTSSKSSKQQQQQQQVSANEERMNRANDTRNHNGYHDHVEVEDQPSKESINELEDLVGKGQP